MRAIESNALQKPAGAPLKLTRINTPTVRRYKQKNSNKKQYRAVCQMPSRRVPAFLMVAKSAAMVSRDDAGRRADTFTWRVSRRCGSHQVAIKSERSKGTRDVEIAPFDDDEPDTLQPARGARKFSFLIRGPSVDVTIATRGGSSFPSSTESRRLKRVF